MDLTVLATDGTTKGTVAVPDSLFGRKPERGLLWETVHAYLANQRQGNACTKTRSTVSGTGKKPYRQKHTGRARHGSRRSPIFVGGAIAWGPKPRDYSLSLPKHKRRLALLSALSARREEGRIVVVEDFELSQPKTKELVSLLAAMGISGRMQAAAITQAESEQPPAVEEGSVQSGGEEKPAESGKGKPKMERQRILLLVPEANQNLVRASRNISWLTVMPASLLNTYAVLTHNRVIFTRSGLERFISIHGKEGQAE